ncbi:MAG TPA: glycerol-3-phosphate dehydrogenase/oxidase [Thermoflexia bacterium]|nr:glycerol-3-phosphate dehydrogenase/oxidase [Thermoflexia bacterium]
MESSPRPFSAATRKENLEQLAAEIFDVLVIGGGITGVSVARDAAMRGFRTALVEKGDFAQGTSSRSSRMIHGGLRYLENYQVSLVFRCCNERRVMRRIAPRLVRPLPFLYPLYRGQTPAPWKLRLGLTLYDALSLFRNVQRHRWLEPEEVARREPLLGGRGLLGAARFYDAQVDDARLTMEVARAAHREGAVVTNYAQVIDLLQAKGRVCGAVVRDRIGGAEIEVRARVVVNATGVWVDTVRQADEHFRGRTVRPTKGIHLLIPRHRLPTQHAIAFDSPRDGRHVFLFPWRELAIVGTTDTDYEGDLDSPAASWEDVEYLLEALAYVFPGAQVGPEDVVSTYAGLRPLLYAEGGTYALSREHQILESPSGLITVAGGKLTTARLMAEQIVDRVERRLAEEFGVEARRPCCTREPIPGAERARPEAVLGDEAVHTYLVNTYGASAAWVMAYVEENPALGERIAPELPYLMAEALYAVQHEMAVTLNDVLIRRTHVIYEARDGGLERARAVAQVMAPRLGWDEAEVTRQVEAYAAQVALTRAWRG